MNKTSSETGATQQHPISLYLKVWGLLFVLSTLSYMVDYMQLQGALRWTLILIFMFLKAGFIISIFMHLSWERLAVKLLLYLPPIAILLFILMMALEGDFTHLSRLTWFTSA